jgi:hypothetical protein
VVRQAKAITPTAGPPSDSELAKLLGDAYEAFQALASRGGGVVSEWRRYTKQSPWVLKVSHGKRSLFYARPDTGAVRVTVLLGGRAVEAALAGQVSKRLHASIRKARAYPEGRPVGVVVKRMQDLSKVEELIAVKLQTTGRPTRGTSRARGRPTTG